MMQESMTGAEALVKIRQFTANDPHGNIVLAPEAGKQIILASRGVQNLAMGRNKIPRPGGRCDSGRFTQD